LYGAGYENISERWGAEMSLCGSSRKYIGEESLEKATLALLVFKHAYRDVKDNNVSHWNH
jgi:hypothetical protein